MEKHITLPAILVTVWTFAVAHLIMNTGDSHPYIAAGFVIFGLIRLEDSLKKDLTS
jgi:hypothetical protein